MNNISSTRRNWVLALLAVAQFVVVLDFSIVSVALPSIQQEFHLASQDLQWVVSAYAILFGGFLLLSGRISDLFDRKIVFVVGLGVFSLASLAGGLAPSPLVILVARAVQGLGAAIVSPVALALVTTIFPEGQQRNRALGIFGSVAGIGFGAGVILGGLLTGSLGWRWVFFVNLPIGLLSVLLAFPLLPSTRASAARQQVDVGGAILGSGAMIVLVLALSRLTPQGGAIQALGLGLLALLLGSLFVLVERSNPHALVPLRIFRVDNLAVGNLIALLSASVAGILAFTLTLYIQRVLDFGPLATGLAFLPAGLSGILGGPVATWVSRRLGLRAGAALGPAIVALSCLLMSEMSATSGAPQVIVGYGIAGVGIVCTLVTTSIAVTGRLQAELQGLAAGLLNSSQQVGVAMGSSLASVVAVTVALAAGGGEKVAATTGYQATLYLALGLSITACVLAWLLVHSQAPQATKASRAETESDNLIAPLS